MAFPILVLLYSKPALALIIATIFVVSGFVAQVIMITTKTALPFMLIDYIDKEALYNVIHYLHHPVWNHISGFFSGFLTGYLIVEKIRWNLSPKTADRLYYVAAPGLFVAIFAPYYWNHYKQKIHKWQMAPYLVLDRALLLLSLAYLTYNSSRLNRRRPQPRNSNQSPSAAADAIKPANQPTSQQSQLNSSELSATVAAQDEGGMKNLPSAISVGDLISSTPSKQQQQQQLATMGDTLSSFSSAPNLTNHGQQQPKQHPDLQKQQQQQQQIASDNDSASKQPSEQRANQNRQPPPPRSTLNTLCLTLSRLTFQLYLANMAVLWIDVNQSKYLWHFSYYFIFVKSMCIYVMSTLVATILYITLESPCVTMYATWAKLRAQKGLQQEKLRQEVTRDVNEANNRLQKSQQLQPQQPEHVATINVVGSHQDQFIVASQQKSLGQLDQNSGGAQQFRYGQYTSVKPAPIHRISTSSSIHNLKAKNEN